MNKYVFGDTTTTWVCVHPNYTGHPRSQELDVIGRGQHLHILQDQLLTSGVPCVIEYRLGSPTIPEMLAVYCATPKFQTLLRLTVVEELRCGHVSRNGWVVESASQRLLDVADACGLKYRRGLLPRPTN
jgi:hypothetical protein